MGQITLHPDVYQKISTVYFNIMCKIIKSYDKEAFVKLSIVVYLLKSWCLVGDFCSVCMFI